MVTRLDEAMIEATDITALRALTSASDPVACVQGYYAAADKAGGVFVYSSTDTSSTDNGGTIIFDAGNRRWKRQHREPINVKWFGAQGSMRKDYRYF